MSKSDYYIVRRELLERLAQAVRMKNGLAADETLTIGEIEAGIRAKPSFAYLAAVEPNFRPHNIAKGVNMFGLVGTHEGGAPSDASGIVLFNDTVSLTNADTSAKNFNLYVDDDKKDTNTVATFSLRSIPLDDGEYATKISSVYEDETEVYSEPVTYTVRRTIAAPTVEINDSVLTITGEGADHYDIYKDGTKIANVPAILPTYDLSEKGYAVGTYEITVTASAMINGAWRESAQSEAVTYTVLHAAPVISVKGDTLTITNGDAYALYYKIFVDGTEKTKSEATTFDLTTLGLADGTYSISVAAINEHGEQSATSKAATYTVKELLAPAVAINGSVLTITGEDAEQFDVYVNGAKIANVPANAAAYDLAEKEYGPGLYAITATALATINGVLESSPKSEAVTYVVLYDAPTISVKGDTLTVTGEGTDQYKIYVDGAEAATGNTTTFDLVELGLADGEYSIKVCAVAQGFIVSEMSEAVAYTALTLLAPVVTIDGDILTVTGDGAEFYTIYKDGEAITSIVPDSPTYDLSKGDYAVGTYEIAAVSMAMVNNGWKKSQLSAPVTYTIAPASAPIASISENKIISIESGDYEHALYIDGIYKGTWGYGYKTFDVGKYYALPVGEYTITFRAIKGGVESADSNAIILKVEITDEPAPVAPTVTYIGYIADMDAYRFKIETKDKVYGLKSRTTGAIEREFTSTPTGGFTTKYENIMANTNGTYYVSYAVANRFGVFGEYSEPIEYVVNTATANAPDAPTLTLDAALDKLTITPAQPSYMRIVVFADNTQFDNMYYEVTKDGNLVPWYMNGPRYISNLATKLRNEGFADGTYNITAKVEDHLGMVNNLPVAGYWSELSEPLQYTLGEVDTPDEPDTPVEPDTPDEQTYTVTLSEDGIATCSPFDFAEANYTLYRVTDGMAEKVNDQPAMGETADFSDYMSDDGSYYVVCEVVAGWDDDGEPIISATCTSNTVTVGGGSTGGNESGGDSGEGVSRYTVTLGLDGIARISPTPYEADYTLYNVDDECIEDQRDAEDDTVDFSDCIMTGEGYRYYVECNIYDTDMDEEVVLVGTIRSEVVQFD